MQLHTYETHLAWSGSTAAGYRAYDRSHTLTVADGVELTLSADPAFRGDPDLPNPEQLLLAAASSCQLLSFLALAAIARVDVLSYADTARAVMPSDAVPVRITEIALQPVIVVRGSDAATVQRLVHEAHQQCYIANTLNADIRVTANVEVV